MQHWKRKILNAGVSLSVVGAGVVLAEGAASAHDAVDQDTSSHQVPFRHLVQGVVASVGTGSFTITTHKGVTKTIDTTSTTVFSETGTPVVPATVAVGQNVLVSLDPTNLTPTAQRVVVVLNRVSGKVLDVTATSITLSGPRDTTHVVDILSGTLFFSGTTAAIGVTVGEFVTAFGNADTTTPSEFDALFIDIGSAPHPAGAPVVPTVPNPNPNPNPGVGHGDNNEHPNGDNPGNGGSEHLTTPTAGVSHVPPATPGATPPAPTSGNGANFGSGRGGPGPSNGGGGQGGQGDGGGGPSGGGSGSGGHGGRG